MVFQRGKPGHVAVALFQTPTLQTFAALGINRMLNDTLYDLDTAKKWCHERFMYKLISPTNNVSVNFHIPAYKLCLCATKTGNGRIDGGINKLIKDKELTES